MAKDIEPKLQKIGEYLKLEEDTIFVIPEYQRPYSWEISHCDKLWQDIVDYSESKSTDCYFFGTIIINCQNSDNDCDENDTILGLIDGQQRTTTFLLLLKALLIRINAAIGSTAQDEDSEWLCNGLKERRRMIMRILYKAEAETISAKPNEEKDRIICNSILIMKNTSINENYKLELQTILHSVDFQEAEKNVIKIFRKQKDNKYTRFFRNFKFFYEKACLLSDSQLNSFSKTLLEKCEVIAIKSWKLDQAITMFNSLNSVGLPLYDADIISAKLYAAAETKNVREKYTALWEELRVLIDDLNQNGIADIDSLLMQQMYYLRATTPGLIVTESGRIDVTTPGLRRYFTQINSNVIKTDPVGLCEQLVNLARIWQVVSSYPIMQVLLKFNANTKLFLASFFHRFSAESIEQAKDEICIIAECMLRLFTILELTDVGFSSGLFKSFLFGELVKLADKTVTVQEIKSDFDKHISEKWTREQIEGFIEQYDHHMLVYLNEFLFARENGFDFSLEAKYDIEHIMPISGANIDEIRKDAEINSIDEFYDIVNLLGNKILLEENINRAIGNEWFRTKVSTTLNAKTGYIDSCYPLANALVKQYKNEDKPLWRKTEIENATQKASCRICDFIFSIKPNET